MKLQNWDVYKKIDNVKTVFGTVQTGIDGTNEQAWNKAAHKYLLGRPYTIGWSMHVRKTSTTEKGRIER